MLQAYKFKGTIDSTGKLVINEAVKIPPGEVEVIILQTIDTVDNSTVTETDSQPEVPKRKSKVKAFEGLFENAPPIPPDFDSINRIRNSVSTTTT